MTSSFSKIFRLIFAIFSLYLMGDAFSRWDGAQYYTSISDFIPSVALVFILWTVVAAIISLLLFVIDRIISQIFTNYSVEDLIIFLMSAIFSVSLLYFGKSMLSNIDMTNFVKIILLLFALMASLFLTWMFHKKSIKLFTEVNYRISPLIWLFSILFILSIPLVAYKTLMIEERRELPTEEESSYEENERVNIILVTFDALTARHMSAYGYNRFTTPFISNWAKSSTLFSQVKSASTYTTPTTASLMTGKRVWTHQTYFVEVATEYVGRNNENLPFLLKKNGYTNVALQQIHQASVEKLGLAENFDIIFRPEKLSHSSTLYKQIDSVLYNMFGEKIIIYDWIIKEDFILFELLKRLSSDSSVTEHLPENAFNKFLEIFDDGLEKPYFTWIHLFPPHDPYLPPEPYMGMFNPSSELRTWKSQMRTRPHKKMAIFRDRYDEFIRYADNQFESFINELEKRNIMKDTVIVLSADHGESFSHNYKGHGGPHLYEELTHIPLIIKEPNQIKGRIVNDLVEQVDITPTILELTKIRPPSWIEGRSLLPLLKDKSFPPKPAFSMSLHGNLSRGHNINKGTIAIWEGDYKLIHYLDNNQSLLFNLKKDPDESTNLYDIKPIIGNHLLMTIKDNLKTANEKIMASQ